MCVCAKCMKQHCVNVYTLGSCYNVCVVENERYSIAYFDCVTAIETPYMYLLTSVKCGAQMRCVHVHVDAATIDATAHCI